MRHATFRSLAASTALGATVVLSPVLTPAPAMAAAPSWCRPSGDLEASELPARFDRSTCDVRGRFVRLGTHVRLQVPGANKGVAIAADYPDGREASLRVSVDPSGSVFEIEHPGTPEASEGSTVTTGGPAPCSDTYYVGAGYQLGHQLVWYYNTGGGPTYLTNTQLTNSFTKGMSNMVLAKNDCGDTRVPTSSAAYGGGTPRASGATATTCTFDGVSVAGWRNMGTTGPLAVACTNFPSDTRRVSEGDWAVNSAYRWDDTTLDGCSNAWILPSVMTHEWGHTVGLGHSPENTHGYQTMSTHINGMCQNQEQTLAKGEVDAMIIKYGAR